MRPEHPAGRHPGPVGHPGHRLLALGPEPDIIEDQVTYPIVTRMLGAPKVKAIRGLLRLRLLLRLRHIPGRHGHLLGAEPRPRISEQDPPRLPAGRPDRDGARRDRRRLGVSIRARRQDGTNNLAELRRFQDWYLRYWLQAVPGRRGGRVDRRLPEAVPGEPGSQRAPRVQHPAHEGHRGDPEGNNDVGGRLVEFRARNTWSAAAAMPKRSRTSKTLSSARR